MCREQAQGPGAESLTLLLGSELPDRKTTGGDDWNPHLQLPYPPHWCPPRLLVVGLICNNNETAYLEEMELLSSWCKDNNLDLNVAKTKEVVVDFRRERQRIHYVPLRIYGTPVERGNDADHGLVIAVVCVTFFLPPYLVVVTPPSLTFTPVGSLAIPHQYCSAYSRLEESVHQLKDNIREKDRLIDDLISVALSQSKHISYIQAPRLPSSPSRLSQAVASDSAATLPWAPVGTNPDPGAESPSAAVNERSAAVLVSGIAAAAGEPLAPVPAQPAVDEWARLGARPRSPILTSTPNRTTPQKQLSWSEVVRGGKNCGRNCSGAKTSLTGLELSNRYEVLPDDAPAHPTDAAVVAPSSSSLPMTQQHHLKLALLNTRSLNNKSLILNEFITDNNLDFLCLTETWHKPLDYFSLNQITPPPPNYTYIEKARPEGRGGGVATVYRKDVKTTAISIPDVPSFEQTAFKLSGPTPLVTAVIYRPPKPNPSFLSDFSDFLTQLCAISFCSPSVLLLGDFNFHVNDPNCKPATEFLDLLHCLNFTQHIDFPTHTRGHTLDLVCSSGLTLNRLSSLNLNISDHLAIIMDIDTPIPTPKNTRKITFRNIKSIPPSALSASLATKMSASPPLSLDNPSDLVNYYNHILSSCLDQLAPIKTKTVTFTHSAPWYTPELHKMKARKRQLERLYKKTGLTVHHQAYTDHLHQYKDVLNSARSTYYSNLIHCGSSNPKALFSTINKLLKPSDNISSSFTVNKCNAFLSFFQNKIDTIYSNLTTSTTPSTSPHVCTPCTTQSLSQFSPVSPIQLSRLMVGMKSSTCALDPIPSTLVKDCFPAISPLITDIINSSFSSGSVPDTLKLAAVTPILKKPGLNPDTMSNFRPISNLPFLSKILERAVATQLNTHLTSNDLFEPFQSGFRSRHSTETVLLKVTNDLLLSSDSGHLSIRLLLDLTAAFDTISHTILLSRLESSLNITGSALSWLRSYLTNRQQFISINNCTSSTAPLSQGVPQGSVLGPLLFILYMLPLSNIIRRHGLHFHCYADDVQLYISTESITTLTHSTLTNYLTEIKSWMHSNFLQLNYDKSDMIIIGPKSLTKTAYNFSLTVDNSTLSPSNHIRNLGVILDSNLSLEHHVNHITRTAFFHLKNIARLRPSLSFSAAEILIHAFITSRLDYCNSILYGSSSKVLNKLQYIQNSAARLFTHTRSRDHITPVLQQLHWLPIPQRIHFKILLLTYKALHNQAPCYLTNMLHHHTPSRSLRSSDLLSPPLRTKHRTWGDRAFSIAAPTLWNSLPNHIRDCTQEQLALLYRQLQEARTQKNDLVFESQLSDQLNRLLETSDSNAVLILKISALTREVRILERRITRSTNSTGVSALRGQLEEKTSELEMKKEQMERSNSNAQLKRQVELDNKIKELQDKGDGVSADYQRQWKQKSELITKKTSHLNRETDKSQLNKEILELQNELMQLGVERQLSRKTMEAKIKELRATLDQKKKQQDDLRRQLEATDPTQAEIILKIISIMRDMRNLHDGEQDGTTGTTQAKAFQTMLQAKEGEYAKAQEEIKDLQRKLETNKLECSGLQHQYDQLKAESEDKIAKLSKAGESKAAVVLEIINQNVEIEALRGLITATDDPDNISELQKLLEEKEKNLKDKKAELEKLGANQQTILRIIEIQSEIWHYQKEAASNTTSDHIRVLKIITLQSQVEHLKRQLSQLQLSQTMEITMLTKQLNTKKTELQRLTQELNAKNEANANLILRVTELQNQLRNMEKQNVIASQTSSATITGWKNKLKAKEDELSQAQSQVRVLQTQLDRKEEQCSDIQMKQKQLQNDLDTKMRELEAKSDTVTSLVLGIINLNHELEALKGLISTADNQDKISELQKLLEEKEKNLKDKKAELEKLGANQQTILRIIEIQSEIWHYQKEAASNTTSDHIRELQKKLDSLTNEIEDKDSTKLMLKIITLQSQVEHLKRQLSQLQLSQTTEITMLIKQLNTKETELQRLTQELNEKNEADANLILRVIELQNQLRNMEKQNVIASQTSSAIITDWKNKLKAKEDELSQAQSQVRVLQTQLERKEEQCSDIQMKQKQLQNDLDTKMRELEAKSDTVTSLVLQVSTLTQQVEALNTQIQSTENSETKIQELQNLLDEKNKELEKKKAELMARSAQAERFLEIIILQTEAETLSSAAVNDTDYAKLAELQKRLYSLIGGIENDDSTKKMIGMVNLQDEIKRLRQQKEEQMNRQLTKIKDLENELEEKKTELEEKTKELGSSKTTVTNVSAQIMDLQQKIKQLKTQIDNLKESNAATLEELENKLSVKEGQLQDSQRLLKESDAKNFQLIMDITDLQSKLKEAQREATKRHEITQEQANEMQKQLKAQEKQIKNLQNANNVLTKQLNTKETELQRLTEELNEKNKADANLILRVTDLQIQLRNMEKQNIIASQTSSATITDCKNKLKAKEDELSQAQSQVRVLQTQLDRKEEQCSDIQMKQKQLQNDLDTKMQELEAKSDTVTSLVLQVSTLTQQVKALNTQIQSTENSETKIQELQNLLDEKNKELEKKKAELMARSAQAERFLEIIIVQTEAETLSSAAVNDTDYAKLAELQKRLYSLIGGIENDDSTKKMIGMVNLQDEIKRLRQQKEEQMNRQLTKIKDLENELEEKKTELEEKTKELGSSKTTVTNVSAQIMDLQQKIKQLKTQIDNLKESNAATLEELENKLSVKEGQLQDSQRLLKESDAKNFQLIMDITDLQSKLKEAQREATKRHEITQEQANEMQKQLKAQEKQVQNLQNANNELKKQKKELDTCCSNAHSRCDEIQKQLTQSQQDADRLQQQLHEKDASFNELQQELQRVRTEKKDLQDQYDNLKAQKDDSVKQLQHELEQVKLEKNNLQDQYNNLKAQKDASVKQLQQELAEVKREKNNLQGKYDDLEAENRQLKDTVKDLNRPTVVDDKTVHPATVALDPDTAHPRVVLSAEGTEMAIATTPQNILDSPSRFNVALAALGKTGFTQGKHYWEVSVARKLCFNIGMASESANRRGALQLRPQSGFWTITKNKQGQYRAFDTRPKPIVIQAQPIKLGVLLDYDGGTISFYDANTRAHLHSFTGQTFAHKIYPFINACEEEPGANMNPFVFIPVSSVDWL
ncbi:LOW QUALITY PROTEIN: uncharacterized protein LOC115374818 [Myripristis murdjan]|uniref:LOW QUALITY PROTEIN: uncharacterized protein LOC115374818 n=1 Tax=Myripristis murdjan TaxID=586833 RepID=UPI0011761EC7|nr:LOW QUALITY PROTEIN: uncharacterized protein LOC115374818 [Myripristis murdjan]